MTHPTAADLPTPTLMRAARGVYARAIRSRLDTLGLHDLPRNAVVVLTAIEENEDSRPDLPIDLGVTKQAVSQVIDTLVRRGYLERSPDPDDRRRVDLAVTDAGRRVVQAAAEAVDDIDAQLGTRLSETDIAAMRSGLLALADIKTATTAAGTGRRRTPRLLRHFSPVFPVADLPRALAHYATLGFSTSAHDDGADYGFANRQGLGLHLDAHADHDPSHGATAYLYVADADALYAEWSRPGIAGTTRPVGPTPYAMRQGSHTDPDGNTIHFGAPLEDGTVEDGTVGD